MAFAAQHQTSVEPGAKVAASSPVRGPATEIRNRGSWDITRVGQFPCNVWG
jgi:hypothetical protein